MQFLWKFYLFDNFSVLFFKESFRVCIRTLNSIYFWVLSHFNVPFQFSNQCYFKSISKVFSRPSCQWYQCLFEQRDYIRFAFANSVSKCNLSGNLFGAKGLRWSSREKSNLRLITELKVGLSILPSKNIFLSVLSIWMSLQVDLFKPSFNEYT